MALLRHARVVLYTPSGEHFGIVPLEAMNQGTAVIAVNDGGPIETIIPGPSGTVKNTQTNHRRQGDLIDSSPKQFTKAIEKYWKVKDSEMSRRCQIRAGEFSYG